MVDTGSSADYSPAIKPSFDDFFDLHQGPRERFETGYSARELLVRPPETAHSFAGMLEAHHDIFSSASLSTKQTFLANDFFQKNMQSLHANLELGTFAAYKNGAKVFHSHDLLDFYVDHLSTVRHGIKPK